MTQTMTDVQIQERARDKRRSEMSEMSLSTRAGELMVPTDGRDLMDKANAMSGSGLMVKDVFRGNPGACAGLIMLCAPYRINPFQASWKCYQVKPDAPLAFEAQFVMAMINTAAPLVGRLNYTFEGEGPTRVCIVTGKDRDSGTVLDYRSPMKKDILVQNSPLWKSDPDQQLCYYSGRAFARRHYPEILLGVYDREEIETAPTMRDVTPSGRTAALAASSVSILDALPADDELPPVEVTPEPTPTRMSQETAQMSQDLFPVDQATEEEDQEAIMDALLANDDIRQIMVDAREYGAGPVRKARADFLAHLKQTSPNLAGHLDAKLAELERAAS